jgi:hypothetical protein
MSVGCLDRLPFLQCPLHRQLSRRPRCIQRRIEASTEEELLVFPELRLDAVGAVIAQLAQEAIVTAEKLEQKLAGLRLSRRVWWTVRAVEVIGHAGIVAGRVIGGVTQDVICVQFLPFSMTFVLQR